MNAITLTLLNKLTGESIVAKNLKIESENKAYLELNNLYLAIESRDIELTPGRLNTLWQLINKAYPTKDIEDNYHKLMQSEIIKHWGNELMKLPNYDNC